MLTRAGKEGKKKTCATCPIGCFAPHITTVHGRKDSEYQAAVEWYLPVIWTEGNAIELEVAEMESA